MRRYFKLLTIIFFTIVVVLIAALLVIQTSFFKNKLLTYIEKKAFQYKLRIEAKNLDYDLLPLRIRVSGFRLYGGKTNEASFLETDLLQIELPYSSLWRDDVIIQSLLLETPKMNPESLPEPEIPKNKTSNGTFRIDQVRITGGSVAYSKFQIKDLKMNARLEPNRILLDSIRARMDEIALDVSGSVDKLDDPIVRLNYGISGPAAAVSRLFPQAPSLEGKVDGKGQIFGKDGKFRIEGHLNANSISIDGEGDIVANADYKLDSGNAQSPYHIQLNWQNLPLRIVKKFSPDLPAIASISSGSADYSGNDDLWSGAGSFQTTLGTSHSTGLQAVGFLKGTLSNGLIHLEPSSIRSGSSTIRMNGNLDANSMHFNVDASVPNPSDFASLFPRLKSIPGSYEIHSVLHGPYRSLNIEGTVHGESSEVRLDASGSYQTGSEQISLKFNTNADAESINRFYPSAAMEGTLQIAGTASGQISHPSISAQIQGSELQLQNISIGALKADVVSDGKTIRLQANFPDYSTSAQGTYRFQNAAYSLDASLNGVTLEQFASMLPASAQGVSGKVTAEIHATGNIARWQNSNAELLIHDATFQREGLEATIREGGNFQLRDRKIQVSADIRMSEGTLNVSGMIPLEERLPMNLQAQGQTDFRILSMVTDQAQAGGPVFLNLIVRGTRQFPEYSGTIRAENFFAKKLPDGPELTNAKLNADFTRQELRLGASGSLNGSPLTVQALVPLTEKPGEIHATLTSFPLSSVSGSKVQGSMDLRVDARGTGTNPAHWSGDLAMTPANLFVSGKSIQVNGPVKVHMDTGKAELMPVQLTAEESMDVSMQGTLNFHSGEITGKVRGTTDLMILSSLSDRIQAGGKLISNVEIDGNITNPVIQGIVQIQDGSLRVVDSPVLLERVQLEAPVEKERILIRRFDAEMGGGQIAGGGEIKLHNWMPDSINVSVKAKNVGMNYPEDLYSQMNANLTLTQDIQDYWLKGNVDIIRSSYREDIDPRSRLVNSLLSEKEALSPETFSRSRLKLDVQVRSLNDFQMRNNMGKVMAGADLRVTGNLLEPRVSGRVRVRDGSKIYFQGNEFEVERGVIDFYGKRKITPVLDVELYGVITDSSSKEEYEITLPLSGPVDNLDDRDPVSSPALDPNQIYFLILTGRVDAQLSRASSRFLQQQLAGYLAGQVFSDVQTKLASAFGLERVEIQPDLISTETNPGAKMVLGKDFSSSLSLIYSISLTESREQTWIANYKIRRNLDVRFVDQEDGTYTANIRHLVRFGTGATTRSLTRNIPRIPLRKIRGIRLVNHSQIPDGTVLEELKLEEGETYDFWSLQDRIDQLKQDLQDEGFLFAAVRSEEKEVSRNEIELEIQVEPRNRREMVFQGVDVSGKQINEYKKIWREGFSEAAVLESIREDLLHTYHLKGYQKAEVVHKTIVTNSVSQYQFNLVPGPLFDHPVLILKGAQQYSVEELQKGLRPFYTSSDQMYTEAIHKFPAFTKKLSALYVQKGFLKTKIEPGRVLFRDGGTVEREVIIDEGARSRIAEVAISGSDDFPSDLERKLKLRTGAVYDPRALEEDELAISEYYERLGYRNFHMESETGRETTGSNLILYYHLHTGEIARIASIQINGYNHTDRRLIEKRLELKEGDIITHEKLATAQKNLYDLRIFHQANVQTKETDVPGKYDVTVDVTEMKHYEMRYGLRYDTEKGIGGEVQLSDLSLFGTGQSVSLFAKANRANQLFRTVYHSPTLSGLRWKTLLSASYEMGELIMRETNGFGLAEGQRYDFTYQRQTNLWKPFVLIGSYTFESLRIRPIASPDFPFDSFKISRFGATLLSDTRDDPLNAHRGRFVSIDFQYSPAFFLSDESFGKNYSQYYMFKPVRRMIWASGLRVGLATSLGPRLITERFLAGGSYTIRGFEKDRVGPKDIFGNPVGGEALFIINQELRFPIYKWFGGAVFYDAGNVYNNLSGFNPLDLRHSAGFGLRFDSPFGVARLDLGFNLFPEADEPRTVIHFGLGQTF